MGSANRTDAVRVLGKPDAQRHPRTTDSKIREELIYKARGDHKGDLAVVLDPSGTVVEIEESFPVAIPRSRIYK